ncbi:conserved Plasmodium protein, unknown function [Plasmodium malariae]|uniref:HTH OST-type domain-containing protein n=1 Tax=Plasmodium malariae TaxID=5858 RepID=A0A1A8WEL6_PLAMA|nr:conserved Plasmodium protein, unknown function [Plasmodium malariae]
MKRIIKRFNDNPSSTQFENETNKDIDPVETTLETKYREKEGNMDIENIDIKDDATNNFNYINRYLTAIFDIAKNDDSSSSKEDNIKKGTNGINKFTEEISRFSTKNHNVDDEWELGKTYEFETVESGNAQYDISSLSRTSNVEYHTSLNREVNRINVDNLKLKKARTDIIDDKNCDNIFANREVFNYFYSFNENDHLDVWLKRNEDLFNFPKKYNAEKDINGKEGTSREKFNDDVVKEKTSTERRNKYTQENAPHSSSGKKYADSLHQKDNQEQLQLQQQQHHQLMHQYENNINRGMDSAKNTNKGKRIEKEQIHKTSHDELSKNLFRMHNYQSEDVLYSYFSDNVSISDKQLKERSNENILQDQWNVIHNYSGKGFNEFAKTNNNEYYEGGGNDKIYSTYQKSRSVYPNFPYLKQSSFLKDHLTEAYTNILDNRKYNVPIKLQNLEIGTDDNPFFSEHIKENIKNEEMKLNQPPEMCLDNKRVGPYNYEDYNFKHNISHYNNINEDKNTFCSGINNEVQKEVENDGLNKYDNVMLNRKNNVSQGKTEITNLFKKDDTQKEWSNFNNKQVICSDIEGLSMNNNLVKNSMRYDNIEVNQNLSKKSKDNYLEKMRDYMLHNNALFSKKPYLEENKKWVNEVDENDPQNNVNEGSFRNSDMCRSLLLSYLSKQVNSIGVYELNNEATKNFNGEKVRGGNLGQYQGDVGGSSGSGAIKGKINNNDDNNGCDNNGCDNNGYDNNGYDNNGCDNNGYDNNGCDNNGCDNNGCDNNGCDNNWCDNNGCDNNWCDSNGSNYSGNRAFFQNDHNGMHSSSVKDTHNMEKIRGCSYKENNFNEKIQKLNEKERTVSTLWENNSTIEGNCFNNCLDSYANSNDIKKNKCIQKGSFSGMSNLINDSRNNHVLKETLKNKIKFLLEHESDDILLSEYIINTINDYNKSKCNMDSTTIYDNNYKTEGHICEDIRTKNNNYTEKDKIIATEENIKRTDDQMNNQIVNNNSDTILHKWRNMECKHTSNTLYNKVEDELYDTTNSQIQNTGEGSSSTVLNFNNILLPEQNSYNQLNKNMNINLNVSDLISLLNASSAINGSDVICSGKDLTSSKDSKYYLSRCDEFRKSCNFEEGFSASSSMFESKSDHKISGAVSKLDIRLDSMHDSMHDSKHCNGPTYSTHEGSGREKGVVCNSPSEFATKIETVHLNNKKREFSYNNERGVVRYAAIGRENKDNDIFGKKNSIYQSNEQRDFTVNESQYEKVNNLVHFISKNSTLDGNENCAGNTINSTFPNSNNVNSNSSHIMIQNHTKDRSMFEYTKKETYYKDNTLTDDYIKKKHKSEKLISSFPGETNSYLKSKCVKNNKSKWDSGNFENGYFKKKESTWKGLRNFSKTEETNGMCKEWSMGKQGHNKYVSKSKEKESSLCFTRSHHYGRDSDANNSCNESSGGNEGNTCSSSSDGNSARSTSKGNPLWRRNTHWGGRLSTKACRKDRYVGFKKGSVDINIKPKLTGKYTMSYLKENKKKKKKWEEIDELPFEVLKKLVTEEENNLEKLLQSLYDDRILPLLINIKGRADEYHLTDILKSNIKNAYSLNTEKYIIKMNKSANDYVIYFSNKKEKDDYFFSINNLVDVYDTSMWSEFEKYLIQIANSEDPNLYTFSGGRYGMAKELQRRNLPFFKGLYLGELCQIVHISTNKKIIAYENNYLKPISQCHKYTNAKLGIVNTSSKNLENYITTIDELRFYLSKLLKYYKGGFNISTLKKKLKNRFNKQLCESVFHCIKLIEVLQLEQLKDVCIVDTQSKVVRSPSDG